MHPLHHLTETLSLLGFFAAIFLSLYYYLSYRNKERMALIEKGADVTEIYKPRPNKFKFPWIKLGMIIMFAGLGIAFAFILTVAPPPPFQNRPGFDEDMIMAFSILIFGGIGFILGDLLEKRINKNNG